MTQSTKKVTRRDAIKLLGAAAGAAMLANVPTKWSKPSLMSGVLPAHAQTSCIAMRIDVISSTTPTFIGLMLGPSPDEVEGDGFAGSYSSWYCQDECWFMVAFLPEGESMTWTFTTLAGQFTVVWDSNDPIHFISVNLGTGEYVVDGDSADIGCGFAQVDTERDTKEMSFWVQ